MSTVLGPMIPKQFKPVNHVVDVYGSQTRAAIPDFNVEGKTSSLRVFHNNFDGDPNNQQNDGKVEEVLNDGIRLEYDDAVTAVPAVALQSTEDFVNADTMIASAIFRFDELPAAASGFRWDLPALMVEDATRRSFCTNADHLDNIEYAVRVGEDGVGMYRVYFLARTDFGTLHYYDGTNWTPTESFVAGVSLVNNRYYQTNLTLSAECLYMSITDLEATVPTPLATVERSRDELSVKGYWINYGTIVSDYGAGVESEITIAQIIREKGPVPADAVAAMLPSFSTTRLIPRPRPSGFTRTNVGVVVNDGSNTYLPAFRFNNIKPRETDRDQPLVINAITANRLDKVSNEFYETPFLNWVLALAQNPVIERPHRIAPGTEIRIPPFDIVTSDILERLGEINP